MKQKFLFVLFVTAFIIPHYLQAQTQGMEIFRQEGIASWYGREYEGRPTASGEIFDASQLTAAHPSLPFGTMVVVTNRHNNRRVTVRVNDRGPFVAARIIDVSRAAAEQLDMIVTGTAPVFVESIDRIVISSPNVEPAQVSPPEQESPPVSAPIVIQTVDVPPVSTIVTLPANTVVQQPVVTQEAHQIRLTPDINIDLNKSYRLQIGSYRVARNAVETFEKLKSAGLNPAYERHEESGRGEFFRVVLAGVRGADVGSTTEKLRLAGFREALIREER